MTTPKESGWREGLRGWWYSVQDLLTEEANVCLPEHKRVELEHITRDAVATAIAATEARVVEKLSDLEAPYESEYELGAVHEGYFKAIEDVRALFSSKT